ncbi:immunity 53 family protein [Paenimyroides baculatum]|uniref:Immunity protein 53 n=1 Tax=Paenimyroides baculatum TaxID=2608000 RepID=A0A5M6CK39_9FLAO|nr:immunity 53 family protein [Paenimyroides baculatum]KAA5535568.1 hypothetical protein F0460_07240 [Paenimyroides baculatum]
MEIIKWIENWFMSNCDGEWEHENIIKIESTSNPGWNIEITLSDTSLEGVNVDYFLNEISDDNWYGYKVSNNKFTGVGDSSKLIFLLELFKKIILEKNPTTT